MPRLSIIDFQVVDAAITPHLGRYALAGVASSRPALKVFYVSKYVGFGVRAPSREELATRDAARGLKIPTREAINRAAPEMALLIKAPCWLVPVPSSSGRITANLGLCRRIAEFVSGARIKCAVLRERPVESSANRRKRGLPGLSVENHRIIRVAESMEALPAYFVDNVVTTGTTIQACRKALGWGNGLVYADASTRFSHVPIYGPA